VFLLLATYTPAQQLAFPSAEGSGRFATGGRGGAVYEVTNLNNSGTGSLVDAVSQPHRTIVFRVSGTIELGSIILQPKANITIAGQTAPGDGICIKGRLKISASDVIVRHIRVRVDAGGANSSGDAIDIGGSAISDIMVDHVSASYSRDEGISATELADNVTVQWCIISEALTYEAHSFGSLIRGDYGDEKTYHHNLYAHNWGRLPRPGNYTAFPTDTSGLNLDFRNNVVYNWKGSVPGYNDDIGSVSNYNFIGNAYIPGPESSGNSIFRERCTVCTGYYEDNALNGAVPADPWSLVSYRSDYTAQQIAAYKARSHVIPMQPVTTTSPLQARSDVLACAGASVPKRDTIDRRIVVNVLTQTGHSIDSTVHQPEGAWPPLASLPAPADEDHDGMPNDWEIAHGLNQNDPADRNSIGEDGYTQLELYLNSLTGEIVTDAGNIETARPNTCALHQNYPNPFNPATTITFELTARSHASLRVYDLLGREVAVLVDGMRAAGTHREQFNASGLASGVYVARLQAGSFSQSIRLVLTK
jgi:hypothetical protein